MKGHAHLYGGWDYESNYSEGPEGSRKTPLYKHFGYRTPAEMKKAQQRFAVERARVTPDHVLAGFDKLE